MRYYLVALFDTNAYKQIEEIQKNICQKYNIYKNIPKLHIVLEVIGDADMDKLDEILSNILNPYKKFKVAVSDIACFDEFYKSINLKVENKGYIRRLVRVINNTLKTHGFVVRHNITNLDLHVSLVNTNYPIKQYATTYREPTEAGFYKLATIDKFELWKPINNKREMILKSYPLK